MKVLFFLPVNLYHFDSNRLVAVASPVKRLMYLLSYPQNQKSWLYSPSWLCVVSVSIPDLHVCEYHQESVCTDYVMTCCAFFTSQNQHLQLYDHVKYFCDDIYVLFVIRVSSAWITWGLWLIHGLDPLITRVKRSRLSRGNYNWL